MQNLSKGQPSKHVNGVRTITTVVKSSGSAVSNESITFDGVSTYTDSATNDVTITRANGSKTIDLGGDNTTAVSTYISPIYYYIVDIFSTKKIVKTCNSSLSALVSSLVTYTNPGSSSESTLSIKNFSESSVTLTIQSEKKTAIASPATPCMNDATHTRASYFNAGYYTRTDYTFTDKSSYTVYHVQTDKVNVFTDLSNNQRIQMVPTSSTPYVTIVYYNPTTTSRLSIYSDGSKDQTFTSGLISRIQTSADGSVVTTTYTSGKVTVLNTSLNTFTTTKADCVEAYNLSTNASTFMCSGAQVATSSYLLLL